MKLLNESVSPFVKLLMMIAILMACFSFAAVLTSGLMFVFPDMVDSVGGGLAVQAISSFCVFGLAVGAYALVFERNFFSVLKKANTKRFYLYALLLPIICIPIIDFLNLWNGQWHFEGEQLWRQMQQTSTLATERMLSADSFGGLIASLFVMALMPAVLEELFFRGIVQRVCTDLFKSTLVAVIVTSIIFSFVHFEIFSFVPRFFLSLVLGYLFVLGGSLWVSILCHFVNNAVSCLFFFFANKGFISSTDSSLYSQDNYLIVLSIVLFLVLIAIELWIAWKQKAK